MVVRLGAHQPFLETFGLPWTSRHERRLDNSPGAGNGSRSRYLRVSASAPSSPPSIFQVLKAGSGGNGESSNCNSNCSGGSSDSEPNLGTCRNGLRSIQVELQSCQSSLATALQPQGTSRPEPKKSISAPGVLQQSTSNNPGEEGTDDSCKSNDAPPSSKADARSPIIQSFMTFPNAAGQSGGEKEPTVFCFPFEAFVATSTLHLRPTKRIRALHDVDGPGTSGVPCKKRRLRLHLVTSRLSQPYSWPATHILNRESGDDGPVLGRFVKLAAIGALKKAGHQSALIRKAAILNRVRIGVRHAAVLRGHTMIAGMAARGNLLSHGVQLVTSSNGSTGGRFPSHSPSLHDHPMLPAWRPHTTAFHSSIPGATHLARSELASNTSTLQEINPSATITGPHRTSNLLSSPSPKSHDLPSQKEEEDDGVAFPSPDLETRYADLSDDDLDDVYADFGVLFGAGMRSPEDGNGSIEAASGEHFYEEYLDELDGIRWVA